MRKYKTAVLPGGGGGKLMDGRYFQVIARIHTDFSTKFGIPRQSGLIPDLKAEDRKSVV